MERIKDFHYYALYKFTFTFTLTLHLPPAASQGLRGGAVGTPRRPGFEPAPPVDCKYNILTTRVVIISGTERNGGTERLCLVPDFTRIR